MRTRLFLCTLLLTAAATAATLTPGGGAANAHGTWPTDVTIHERSTQHGYGYEGGTALLDLSLIAWSIPGRAYDVKGLRLNLGAAENKSMAGLDIGLGSLTAQHANALQINLFANIVGGTCNGLQIGLFNHSTAMNGLQVGIVNTSVKLKGVQIGLINSSQYAMIPIINVAW